MGRRATTVILFACLLLIGWVGCGDGQGAAPASHARVTDRLAVYVGTYTDATSRGIYRFEFDGRSGASTAPILAATTRNPSFLTLHPRLDVLYAVNEVADFARRRSGAVTAFAIAAATGALTQIAQQPSEGADPCHLTVDSAAHVLLVANYTSGNIAVLPLALDGRLQSPSVVIQHAGSGPDKARQEGPHAHAVGFDPAEQVVLAADLGSDRLFLYRYQRASRSLVANTPASATLPSGSGPRHFAWHPSGNYLYVVNELRSTIAVFRYQADRGALDLIQTVSTLPSGFNGRSKAAEVAVAPNGGFLYASNRGDDSLAVFRIDPAVGTLAAVGHVPTGGRTPRHFAIDPSGDWLLAANQDSDSITVFRLDADTGQPKLVGRAISVSRPVCVLFVPSRH